MNTTSSFTVFIGPKSSGGHNLDNVRVWLDREEKSCRPAWWDGSYLYSLRGKYSVSLDEKGRPSLVFQNDLSLYGVMNHFTPSDYVSYNA